MDQHGLALELLKSDFVITELVLFVYYYSLLIVCMQEENIVLGTTV